MALSRRWLPLSLFIVAIAAAIGGYLWWQAREDAERARQREAREASRRERVERAQNWLVHLQDESRELIPEALGGIALGQTMGEVRTARPGAQASPNQDAQKVFLEERLGNGAQALYGFERRSGRLIQVQVLSLLPSAEAVAPHLVAMREQYGAPTGVWDCPNTEGVPTRRFTWRKNRVSVADVFLVHPGGISLTLYIAPSETIGASLQMSGCQPVRSREQLENFPVATREQLGDRVRQGN